MKTLLESFNYTYKVDYSTNPVFDCRFLCIAFYNDKHCTHETWYHGIKLYDF